MTTLYLTNVHREELCPNLLIWPEGPNRPRSEHIPIILPLKEFTLLLPAPISGYSSILNVLCKSFFQRLSNLNRDRKRIYKKMYIYQSENA